MIGFVHVGNHVSKRVAYWRQNGINILINKEESGPTDSAYELHGTSVCDIAFRVDDATSVIERARGLGAEVMEENEGRDELKIPAIRGVGGGVIRFIDAATGLANWWKVDFRPVETQSSETGLGLETIDHLAQTMNYEEMLTWTLFYTSILELKRVSMVDVIDPGGLVRSWTIQNPASDLRVTLNGAENQNTLAGQFIDHTFGATTASCLLLSGHLRHRRGACGARSRRWRCRLIIMRMLALGSVLKMRSSRAFTTRESSRTKTRMTAIASFTAGNAAARCSSRSCSG